MKAQQSADRSHQSRLFTFAAGKTGRFTIIRISPVIGPTLPMAPKLDVLSGVMSAPAGATWSLQGVTSNERYVTREEKQLLVSKQAALGRAEADHAAIIPIRKNAKWWSLTQEERRAILEERSHHIRKGLEYLPAIARKLHHCRDLGQEQPFDFITQFEFSKSDIQAFEELVGALRATEEWKYVDREVDIRLIRDAG